MEDKKQEFLQKFIEHSSNDGVNEETMYKLSKEVYGDERGYILDFYNGLYDVVGEVEDYLDEQIIKIANLDQIKSVTEKIRKCLVARIYGKGDLKSFYINLSKFYKTKEGISLFAKNSWKTVDIIWKLAGDKSLDWNYYSKRTLLFTIYTSSRKFYINSDIDELEPVLEKINSGLEKVKTISKIKQKLKLENIPFVRLFIK